MNILNFIINILFPTSRVPDFDEDFEENCDYDSYCESESEISDYEDLSFLNDGECLVDDPQGAHEQLTAEEQLRANLADWAATCRIKQIHVTRLLHIQHQHLDFLPLDAGTLLKTMRTVKKKTFHLENITILV